MNIFELFQVQEKQKYFYLATVIELEELVLSSRLQEEQNRKPTVINGHITTSKKRKGKNLNSSFLFFLDCGRKVGSALTY